MIEAQHVWTGVALGLFWTVLVIAVGIAVAVVAVLRARALHRVPPRRRLVRSSEAQQPS